MEKITPLPAALTEVQTDIEKAEILSRRMIEAAAPLLAVLDEADAMGFLTGLQFGRDPFGKRTLEVLLDRRLVPRPARR